MGIQEPKKILALVSDLLFTVKISDAAKRNGMQIEYVKTDEEFLDKVRSMPSLVIMDLNIHSANPVKLIEQVRSDAERKDLNILSFVSHVQGDLKQKAHDAGCNLVLARSAFTQNLQQILKRYAGTMGF
ncbi:MAG: response regulator [Bryobacteraceae bacterium]|nr:response regulator [Bryobacteraceae bacterium]